jgi:hypothetical protein
MRGLVSLSFLAALPLMSALPTNSNPNPTKRGIAYPDLGVVAFNGDSCGTSSFQISSDGHGTNIDDCKGLSAALRSQDRHWPLTNSYGGNNWINVAKNGNCAFWVDRHDMADPNVSSWIVFGTHDVADIVDNAVNNYQKWGTVRQDVQCT